MKNAMKRIMGLLLVAVLLVSVVPFQALAADEGKPVTIHVFVNGDPAPDRTYTATGDFVLDEALAMSLLNKPKGRTFDKWTGASGNEATDNTITYSAIGEGYSLNVYFTEDTTVTPPTPSEPAKQDKKVPVAIYVDGKFVRDDATITVPVDGKVILTSELGLDLVKNDKVFDKWVGYYSDNNATGQTVSYDKITDGYSLKLYVNTKKDVAPITVKIVNPNGTAIAEEFQITPVNDVSSVVENILTDRWVSTWKNSYDFVSAKSDKLGTGLGLATSVNAGDTLTITLKAKAANSADPTTPTTPSTSNKFPYDVVLNVYLDTKVGEPDRRININDLATDGVVSMGEVRNLLTDKYYKAKNSNGIQYDGLYLARGNWVEKWSRDYDKYDEITGVKDMRNQSRVDINVMLTNATRKTSSTADSSNPKTGDAIFMTITVMGLSAAALTGLYFYDKKRKVL